jgi:tRNA A37 threonylcarbamoyladenosine synthetase subunit TsaC/SUA5/YrdC
MKIIAAADLMNGTWNASELVEPLKSGGIICYPDGNSYRLAVDAENETAITRLLQAKKRVNKKPSLMIIPHKDFLKTYIQNMPLSAQKG